MSKPQDLIALCKQGEPMAYTKLYNLYAKYVYNVICRYVNSSTDAEDILQETFLDAYSGIDKLNSMEAFGSWIKRIAVNKAVSWLRKRKVLITELEPEQVWIEEETIDEDDFEYNMNKIIQAISTLPASYKTVFQLYAIENYSHVEIAQMLGMTHTGVRTQYFRAKNKLLLTLKDLE